MTAVTCRDFKILICMLGWLTWFKAFRLADSVWGPVFISLNEVLYFEDGLEWVFFSINTKAVGFKVSSPFIETSTRKPQICYCALSQNQAPHGWRPSLSPLQTDTTMLPHRPPCTLPALVRLCLAVSFIFSKMTRILLILMAFQAQEFLQRMRPTRCCHTQLRIPTVGLYIFVEIHWTISSHTGIS